MVGITHLRNAFSSSSSRPGYSLCHRLRWNLSPLARGTGVNGRETRPCASDMPFSLHTPPFSSKAWRARSHYHCISVSLDPTAIQSARPLVPRLKSCHTLFAMDSGLRILRARGFCTLDSSRTDLATSLPVFWGQLRQSIVSSSSVMTSH